MRILGKNFINDNKDNIEIVYNDKKYNNKKYMEYK